MKILALAMMLFSQPGGKLFVATSLTQPKQFTPGIEGPQCDQAGNLYAVNFENQQTIGKVSPDGKAGIFVTLPGESTGNGIVFDQHGRMYVADYVGHNVLQLVSSSSGSTNQDSPGNAGRQPND